MGFFSFKTNDTKRSIPNVYQDVRETFGVYMLDDKGNHWYEPAYEGYGTFGGKSFYELLAEMNDIPPSEAVKLGLSKTPHKQPNLVEKLQDWVDEHPGNCEHQGFFYPTED